MRESDTYRPLGGDGAEALAAEAAAGAAILEGSGRLNPVKEGERLFNEGDLEGAQAMFGRALEECPGNFQALNNLAVVAITKGENQKAMGYLRSAVELKPDFLEGRFNLAELYGLEGKWNKAAKELKSILEFKPDDLPALKRLAHAYVKTGEPEKAKKLLDGSGNLGAMKAFINSLWLGIKFYSMAEGLSDRDRLEKLMFAVLKLIDGQDGRSLVYRLVATDPDTGQEIALEKLSESFYYQESSELREDVVSEEKEELILTVGDHDDWILFHDALKEEMRAEGGCLGDYTQTKKVFKNHPELAKYDLNSTLKYFQANVGPCDCHVLRAVLV
ncbi:MAG: tetratricopeptide repeat protein [Deltaproteobacteria bacterium]|jgi:tetratricopeptide (TPR) repeat protein|nr:tetratricopeptide repeat protein [Deltaproteobacteria bacterium]